MIDRGITAFYNQDIDEMRKEFKDFFNLMSDGDDIDGIYTFYFSRYHQYTISTEICYCMVTAGTAIFLSSPQCIKLTLDHNLQVTNGDITPDAYLFDACFMQEKIFDMFYIGDICNNTGNVFYVYTLKYETPKNIAISMYEHDRLEIDFLTVDEDDLMDVSLDCLEKTIDLFHSQVESAIVDQDAYIGLDENPFANRYYDKEFQPRQTSIRLGESDV